MPGDPTAQATAAPLDAYLARIGLSAPPALTPEALARLISAHRRAIAFENLDIRLGRPIRIDSVSVFDKLVRRRRGGYCFEQNRLLADMLVALGFAVRPLLARVRMGLPADALPPRTHVTLLVTLDGQPWIAEGGFGGSDLPALPLADGAMAASPDGAMHRLRHVGALGDSNGEWLVERAAPPDAGASRAPLWQPQFSFDLAQVAPADLEQANHWTSTRPGERFTSLHIATIVLPGGFASLVERTLTEHRAGEAHSRRIADPADYARTLRTLFALDVSDAEAAALPLFADLRAPASEQKIAQEDQHERADQ